MRISDWSSDVCSSDLISEGAQPVGDRHDDQLLLGGNAGPIVPWKVPSSGHIGTSMDPDQNRVRAIRGGPGYGQGEAVLAHLELLLHAGQEGEFRRGLRRSEERRGGKEGASTCRS